MSRSIRSFIFSIPRLIFIYWVRGSPGRQDLRVITSEGEKMLPGGLSPLLGGNGTAEKLPHHVPLHRSWKNLLIPIAPNSLKPQTCKGKDLQWFHCGVDHSDSKRMPFQGHSTHCQLRGRHWDQNKAVRKTQNCPIYLKIFDPWSHTA